jgi:hypothetical protein
MAKHQEYKHELRMPMRDRVRHFGGYFDQSELDTIVRYARQNNVSNIEALRRIIRAYQTHIEVIPITEERELRSINDRRTSGN